jgi:indole-3-glycerol phosphate synthase
VTDVLTEILAHKAGEVAASKERRRPEAVAAEALALRDPVRSLRAALTSAPRPRVIAELKRRSPSKGEIRADFDPAALAKAYAEAGAAALSVLTDERFFGGHLDFLRIARGAAPVPILRKDFVIDPYQIDEARAAGADAVLLIVAALPPARLRELHAHARGLGLDALVEVHDEGELRTALEVGASIVGVNNRDLRTFHTDLATTERLAPLVPPGVVLVAESGIFRAEDVRRLEAAGAHACLVGESLMREADVGAALRRLRGSE